MVEKKNMATEVDTDPITSPAALTPAEVDAFVHQINSLESASSLLEGRVSKNPSMAAIIVAGGAGERFRNPGGKQLFEVLGKPVLTWSAEAFDAVPEVGLIVIVCPEDRQAEYCRAAIDPYPFVTPIEFAPAGELRQESAMNGLAAIPDTYEYVAVHDGARPLVTPEIIVHALNLLKGNLDSDGVVVGHPSVDTLKVVNDRTIVGTPDRSMFWIAQTPQVFRVNACRRAHKAAMYDGFVGTDDSSLIERLGGHVLMFDGPRDNIKVTVPEDVGPVIAALSARVAQREE
jgi:2-C-methyl-D-erythritol 4-phosphate cytidylyltransferase